MKTKSKYDNDLTALTELLNPNNTISAHRYLAHSIGMTECIIYSALISKQIFYSRNNMLVDGWLYSTISDLEESTTYGVKAQKSAINKLIQLGFVECVVRGLPAKRFFRICVDMDTIKALIDKGKEIVKKFAGKVNNNSDEKAKKAENIQYVPKEHTCLFPQDETCCIPSNNKTKDIKPKKNNLLCNQSVNRSASAKIDGKTEYRRKKTKFSDVLKCLGIDWSRIISTEPISEKDFVEYDEEIRYTQKCTIPYSLKENKDALKAALEYLSAKSYYSGDDNAARTDFFNVVISTIADIASCDKVIVQGRTVMYYEVIDRLNEIIRKDYLGDWLISFEEHWQSVLVNNKITNKRAYIKPCIWNWLQDYNFESFNDILHLESTYGR